MSNEKMNAGGRAAKHPAVKRLSIPDIFDSYTGKPDALLLRDHFTNEGRLTEEAAIKLIRGATEVFRRERNVIVVDPPVTVVGDIHGQYFDLLKVTSGSVGGDPASTKYLFLGDYVDRGCFSIECLLYIWTLKQLYPNTISLIRGNHECRHLTAYFSFKHECTVKYGETVYEAALESFNAMPLAALLNNRFFCVHGGLSPELFTIDDVNKIDRFREPPGYGPMCDLLWADPAPNYGADSHTNELFTHNAVRGCSYYYSYSAVVDFLRRNKLLAVIRAHEAQNEGYQMHRKTGEDIGGFPSLITVFSAPNYLDVYGNKGAVLKYDGQTLNIRQYNSSEHPYWLPNFANVFTWSLPFVGDKVTDMLVKILSICSDDELNRDEDDKFEGDKTSMVVQGGMTVDRKRAIRSKIQAVGKMKRTFATLREESESVLVLKGLSPTGLLPVGVLSAGPKGIQDAVDLLSEKGTGHRRLREVASFDEARTLDSPNERMPPLYAHDPTSEDHHLPPTSVEALKRPPLRPTNLFPAPDHTVRPPHPYAEDPIILRHHRPQAPAPSSLQAIPRPGTAPGVLRPPPHDRRQPLPPPSVDDR